MRRLAGFLQKKNYKNTTFLAFFREKIANARDFAVSSSAETPMYEILPFRRRRKRPCTRFCHFVAGGNAHVRDFDVSSLAEMPMYGILTFQRQKIAKTGYFTGFFTKICKNMMFYRFFHKKNCQCTNFCHFVNGENLKIIL
jgi:hypothetical protein